jgi:hypothetical protein
VTFILMREPKLQTISYLLQPQTFLLRRSILTITRITTTLTAHTISFLEANNLLGKARVLPDKSMIYKDRLQPKVLLSSLEFMDCTDPMALDGEAPSEPGALIRSRFPSQTIALESSYGLVCRIISTRILCVVPHGGSSCEYRESMGIEKDPHCRWIRRPS